MSLGWESAATIARRAEATAQAMQTALTTAIVCIQDHIASCTDYNRQHREERLAQREADERWRAELGRRLDKQDESMRNQNRLMWTGAVMTLISVIGLLVGVIAWLTNKLPMFTAH